MMMNDKKSSGKVHDPIRRHLLAGVVVVAMVVGGFGGWSALASLSGAVIAPGNIVVDSNVKRVQHPDGGVVGEIKVRDGQMVQAGELLIRLDDTITRANLMVIETQLVELEARRGRLVTERDEGDAVRFAEAFEARRDSETSVDAAIAGETSFFASRRAGRLGQIAQLRERIAQLEEEARGLAAQIEAKGGELDLIGLEIQDVDSLYGKGLAPLTRLRSLQRERTRLAGERGQLQADLARSKGRMTETQLQILQIDQDFRTEVIEHLRDVEAKWGELVQKQVAARDQLRRVELRAPISGHVHQLAVHTVGGVVGPTETIMLVVPQDDELTIEAKVQPTDIDQLHHGQIANVRLAAFNQRTTPELRGKVERISADLTTERETGVSYYTIRIGLLAEDLAKLDTGLTLMPGMPAEVYVTTGERTPLSYFMKPLADQLHRALREE